MYKQTNNFDFDNKIIYLVLKLLTLESYLFILLALILVSVKRRIYFESYTRREGTFQGYQVRTNRNQGTVHV